MKQKTDLEILAEYAGADVAQDAFDDLVRDLDYTCRKNAELEFLLKAAQREIAALRVEKLWAAYMLFNIADRRPTANGRSSYRMARETLLALGEKTGNVT